MFEVTLKFTDPIQTVRCANKVLSAKTKTRKTNNIYFKKYDFFLCLGLLKKSFTISFIVMSTCRFVAGCCPVQGSS